MCHGSEICNCDIKQTTFGAIVENLKDQNVKLYLVDGRGDGSASPTLLTGPSEQRGCGGSVHVRLTQ